MKNLKNMDTVDLLCMVLYSIQRPKPEDALSDNEIDEALKIIRKIISK